MQLSLSATAKFFGFASKNIYVTVKPFVGLAYIRRPPRPVNELIDRKSFPSNHSYSSGLYHDLERCTKSLVAVYLRRSSTYTVRKLISLLRRRRKRRGSSLLR
jgi:hypothetical protein